ncbi:MAG: hypothetical protein ACR5LG_12185 [Sodalis sp. (in: enterobacteria)]|uniref:hypothetical protein n=1 Tax=Sodalis sp. (in: enterobacteria) TaxID=1898979 RepID=UPI003F3B73A7
MTCLVNAALTNLPALDGMAALLAAALSDGRVLKGADEDWARRLDEKDMALLREHLATRHVSRLPRCRGCRPAATRRRVSRRGHRPWAHWMRRRWPPVTPLGTAPGLLPP